MFEASLSRVYYDLIRIIIHIDKKTLVTFWEFPWNLSSVYYGSVGTIVWIR